MQSTADQFLFDLDLAGNDVSMALRLTETTPLTTKLWKGLSVCS